MGKSYNRNQDKYNKWDRERQQRNSKKNKFKNTGQKKQLTQEVEWNNVDSYGGQSDY
jgi:hypothetical protein